MWRQRDAAALQAENVLNRRGVFFRKTSPAATPPSQVSHFTDSPFPLLRRSDSLTVHLRFQTEPPKQQQLLLILHPPSPQPKPQQVGVTTGALSSSVQNDQDRAEAGHATGRFSQLEAVAMAFLSCWLRISRVRDSRSRSWQVLQTNTGSYSCWSGMGSFR